MANPGTVANTLTGARAKVVVNGKIIGVATDVNWSLRLSQEPVHTLGRYEPAEIVPVAQEAVDVTVNGLRLYGIGPHKGFTGAANTELMVPTLATLLTYQDIQIQIFDRAQTATNAAPLMTVTQCRSTGYSQSVNAKGLMTLSVTFTGIRALDETVTDAQDKDGTASPYTIS